MSFTYSIIKLDKLGDYSEQYGQRYWIKVSEELSPISFNSQNQDIKVGSVIEAEETVNKRSAKGTDYIQLKKVKLVGANEALQRIERKVDLLLGNGEEY